jgi:phosphatidylglycerol---prolipoprotein diacylglyceryl transferase
LNPIALNLGPLPIHWYGIILGLGALAGLLIASREGKRYGLSPDFFMDLLFIGVPSAIICARIYFVAFKWQDYKDNLLDVFKIWQGGIAIYGALIGAIIGGYIYISRKGYSFWRIADICAPGLIAGQMIGRWGNFVNQEAYGGPVNETFLRNSLHLPDFIVNNMLIDGVYHHPTFLYESLWNLAGLILLFVLRRRPFLRAGELFASYFIWYSLGRFFIEALRTDSLTFTGPAWVASFVNGLWSPMKIVFEAGSMTGNIRISQLLAICLIIAGAAFIIVRRVKGYATERYADPIVSTRAAVAGTAALEPRDVPVEEAGSSAQNNKISQPDRSITHDQNDPV